MNKSINKKTMNKSIKLLSAGFILGLAFLQSCEKDPKPNVAPINEGELITTIILSSRDSASGQIRDFVFRDKDGEGGNAASQFDSIELSSGHTYYFELILLDESKAETDTISNEVLNEGEDHLFVYIPKNIDLVIGETDKDKNGLALGLKSTWKANSIGRGNVNVILKHQPGIKNGDPLLGETDIAVDFKCLIK
jgi:hypothetical protein